MRVLGIIPARGGSKGVKHKNIKLLDGKPLITYAIDAAKESKLLTDFILTSDDKAILNIAKSNDCRHHKRTLENAQDESPVILVVEEVLNHLNPEKYDLLVLLQPTAPIRTGQDIDQVISMFKRDEKLQNVVSVIKLEDIHPARMYEIDDGLNLLALQSEKEKEHRQELSPVYLRNGCIYAITTKAFIEENTLMLKEKKAYIMPQETWVNIDTERDFLVAETLVKLWKSNKL